VASSVLSPSQNVLARRHAHACSNANILIPTAGLITLGGAPQYTASKHAVLGLMRAIAWPNAKLGIKVAAVTPWFVGAYTTLVVRLVFMLLMEYRPPTATGILAPSTRALLSGLPLAPVDRVAGAIVYAATEPDVPETGGCVYALIDGKSAVTRFPKTSTVPGIYGELEARIDALFGLEAIVRQAPRWFKRIGVPLALVAAAWVAQAKLLSS
jgi:NAD(P)-dependent dehydrogenase (short-subunit alcohol dehydrogenase family)